MKFGYMDWRQPAKQSFDRENITIKKAGKEYNVYDKIQEAREDTEIYQTLEKYGCIDRMMLDHQGVYDDFTQYGDLRTLKEQQMKANDMFYNLPLDVRQKFNNDVNQFMKDGQKFVKKMVDDDIKRANEIKKLEEQSKIEVMKPIEGVTENGK